MPTLELWLSCFTKPLSTMYLNVDKNSMTMCLPKGVRETVKPLDRQSLLTLCHWWWERLQQCLWPRHTFLFLEVVAERSAVVDLRQKKKKERKEDDITVTPHKADTGFNLTQLCVFTSRHGSIKGQNEKAIHWLVCYIIAIVYALGFLEQHVTGVFNLRLTCQKKKKGNNVANYQYYFNEYVAVLIFDED